MRTFLFLLFSLIFISQSFAQDMAVQQDAWMESMTPGPQHEMLAKLAGNWDVVAKFWMDPSAPPQESTGKVESEMILGGRYLKSHQTGSVMGMPMEGLGYEAYDKAKNKFVSIWLDNMGTGIAYAEGEYDAEKKATVYWGTMTDPMMGDTKYKMVNNYPDEDTIVMEMFVMMGESEMKMMEMKYTRVK